MPPMRKAAGTADGSGARPEHDGLIRCEGSVLVLVGLYELKRCLMMVVAVVVMIH